MNENNRPKQDLRSTRERVKQNLNPWFLKRGIDELFFEILEVSEYPPDWPEGGKITLAGAPCDEKYSGTVWPSKNAGKFFIKRKLENRRDTEKLRTIIQRQMDDYLTLEKDSDKYLFRQNRLEKIDEYEAEFCTDLHRNGKQKERTICKDLEAYKAVLMDMIPNETRTIDNEETDGRRSKNTPSNPERLLALKVFCESFVRDLAKVDKDTKQRILHLITGVNREDAYKYLFGHRQGELKDVDRTRIDVYLEILNKAKKDPTE